MIVQKPSTDNPKPRGAFIVFEGVDRCGKTTQVGLLVKHLMTAGLAAMAMNFPDRTTMVGDLINQYLKSKQELDDRSVHLLFSANRWEAVPKLEETLSEGTTIVCDRYAYSGVAFSSSKPNLATELEWCKSCDVGLPAPDAVIFLDITQEQAEKRGGFGDERYEQSDMQKQVRKQFDKLQKEDEADGRVPWHFVNAAQTVDEVQHDINKIVESTISSVQESKKPVGKLWKAEK